MSRYNGYKKFRNDSEYYSPLRKSRELKSVVQYGTPLLYHPNIFERASLQRDTHIWKYGDRFYNLADKYYNNPDLWWIIAWYNGYPTEAHIRKGDVIEIPVSLEEVSSVLGV